MSSPPGPPAGDESPGTFEATLTRLQEILQRLERGDLSLEASLASYEEGIGLIKQCNSILDRAEERLEMLQRQASGELLPQPLCPEELGPRGGS